MRLRCVLQREALVDVDPDVAGGDHRETSVTAVVDDRYSWLPGAGLNLIPCSATPFGFVFAASVVFAVQSMFGDVAEIAVVPESTGPVPRLAPPAPRACVPTF